MESFIESYDDFKQSKKMIDEGEVAEFNTKLKELGDRAKDSKALADKAKENYDRLVKGNGDSKEIEIELLTYRKYKGKSDMLNAEIRLALLQKKKLKDLDTGVEPSIEGKPEFINNTKI